MTSVDRGSRDGAVIEEGLEPESATPETVVPVRRRPFLVRWLANDLPFIAMLLLAFAGLAFRLPLNYWLVLIPVFAVLTIVEGWSRSATRNERLGHVLRVLAIWGALLLSIYFLINSVEKGVLDANATSLAMTTLLALGTFVAGLQARVWRVSAVGCVLFLAVPGFGWLDQSLPLLAAATFSLIVLAGFYWWFKDGRKIV